MFRFFRLILRNTYWVLYTSRLRSTYVSLINGPICQSTRELIRMFRLRSAYASPTFYIRLDRPVRTYSSRLFEYMQRRMYGDVSGSACVSLASRLRLACVLLAYAVLERGFFRKR